MNGESELLINALGRPLTIAAQVSCRSVLSEPSDVGIERGLAFGARRHRAVAEQNVYVGAAERQRRSKRALERHCVRVRADRRREQYARTIGRGSTRRLPPR